MDLLMYKQRLENLEKNFEKDKRQLYHDYAMSQVIFKNGDIIKDERWILRIDKITSYVGFHSLPQPVYSGYELKKDLTPRKDRNRVSIHGNGAELVKSA
jgi:hypothetical protein